MKKITRRGRRVAAEQSNAFKLYGRDAKALCDTAPSTQFVFTSRGRFRSHLKSLVSCDPVTLTENSSLTLLAGCHVTFEPASDFSDAGKIVKNAKRPGV